LGGAGSEAGLGVSGIEAGVGGLAGGELEENFAEILENHELRRCGGVPTGVGLSTEFEREGLL
jgi:hypothetical protein